ncbi:MAG: gfo/Idh/MocA family oxidoreductase [Verrucomicrobia bacterium]|nr:MAG: gfo/Idh/MocA family oxidoreductase [Verrucomicrobiota bacterium]
MKLDPEHPAPPVEEIRIGMIGLGGRGRSLLRELLKLPEGVEICVLADPDEAALDQAADLMREALRPPAELRLGQEPAWMSVCQDPGLDLVIIASPWHLHATQAVTAMSGRKHVFVEVPAALTIEECWDLVNTSEQTSRYCILLENCCFGRSELAGLNMVRSGLLGQITHTECAYIHDLREVLFRSSGEGLWRRGPHTRVDGNLYPTHGLGPVATCLDLNHGDRIERIVSMSSPEAALSEAARDLPEGHPGRTEKFVTGDVNTSLLRTELGRSILVQHDVVSPRPYSRINGLVGTRGSFFGFPDRLALDEHGAHEWLSEKELKKMLKKYDSRLWSEQDEDPESIGGHGGMDYVMMARLIDCLRTGRYPDIDVYDAAAWSSIYPLSIDSVNYGSQPHSVPDFTRGWWKRTPRIFLPEEIGPTT